LPKQESEMTAILSVDAQLFSRRLIPRSDSDTAPSPRSAPPTLTRIDRSRYLVATELMDFRSASAAEWRESHDLRRRHEESQVEFARRVYLAIRGDFRYSYAREMNRRASSICEARTSDCGGLSILFVATLRANQIPARLLVGRWARSATPGETNHGVPYYQNHVKSEFFADGLGWIPVDISLGLNDKTHSGTDHFGNDPGDFLVLHLDHGLGVDTVYFGEESITWLQGIKYWVTGRGSLEGSRHEYKWVVKETDRSLSIAPAPQR
ncbi:MAG: transglutaminase-like domain-containing protein, partial [Verrucomicrobiota bacterium]